MMSPGFPEEIWCPFSSVLQDTLLKGVASAHPCCKTVKELELEKCSCFLYLYPEDMVALPN